MIKKETQFWESLLFVADCAAIAGAWLFAYWLRFRSGYLDTTDTTRGLAEYALPLLLVPPVWGLLFHSLGLYRPRRV